MRICIDGNIGAGKSSCVEAIRKLVHTTWGLVYTEPVDKWADMLPLFCREPHTTALPLQIAVLMAYAQPAYSVPQFISERGPHTGRHVFGECSAEQGHITPKQMQWYIDLHDDMAWTPDVIIMIRTDPSKCLQRLRSRGRRGEENITLQYLFDLDAKHTEMLSKLGDVVKCFTVDGNGSLQSMVADVTGILRDLGVDIK